LGTVSTATMPSTAEYSPISMFRVHRDTSPTMIVGWSTDFWIAMSSAVRSRVSSSVTDVVPLYLPETTAPLSSTCSSVVSGPALLSRLAACLPLAGSGASDSPFVPHAMVFSFLGIAATYWMSRVRPAPLALSDPRLLQRTCV
jgi:hypothetical protein